MFGTYSYDQRVQDFATLIIVAGVFLAVLCWRCRAANCSGMESEGRKKRTEVGS